MNSPLSITTDTAALSIFDLQAIRHRLEDTPDWWTIEEDELQESNNGNILFLHLEDDGTYNVDLLHDLSQPQVTGLLHAPSGQLFVGAAEDTTGGDLEPDNSGAVSGKLWTVQPGIYKVDATRQQQSIQLAFTWLAADVNELQPIRPNELGDATDEQSPFQFNRLTQRLRL